MWFYQLFTMATSLFSNSGSVLIAMVADSVSSEDRRGRGQGIGLVAACYGMGMILGPVIGIIVNSYTLQTVLYTAAVLSVVAAAYAALILKETKRTHAHTAPNFTEEEVSYNPLVAVKDLLQDKRYQALAGAVFFANVGEQAISTLFFPYFDRRFHASTDSLNVYLTLFGLTMLIGPAVVLGQLLRCVTHVRVLQVSLLLTCFHTAVTALSPVLWLNYAILPIQLISILSYPCACTIAAQIAGDKEQGKVQATLDALRKITDSFGPIAFGTLMSHTVKNPNFPQEWAGSPLLGCTLLTVVATVLSLYVRAPKQKGDEERSALLDHASEGPSAGHLI